MPSLNDSASKEAFNPLAIGTLSEELIRETQQSTVANICQSYHGRFDSFAEAVQNAVDAIEKRWADWKGPGNKVQDGSKEERPQLSVIIDCDTNLIDVIDNGIGMDEELLRQALVPNVTFKRHDKEQRGQKGVGTTYLTYGHNLFSIESKTPSGLHSYELRGGLDWSQTTPVWQFPVFEKIAPLGYLKDHGRGTAVRMQFGIGTTYGNLSGTFFNHPQMWEYQLRSYTALGLIRLGCKPTEPLPPWVEHMDITLDLRNTPGKGICKVEFEFPFPHKYLPEHEVAELQVLQNDPHTRNKFKLIYFSRNHADLMLLLGPELEDLKTECEKAAPGTQESQLYDIVLKDLGSCEIAAYASLAYTNRHYEQVAKAIINPDGARLPASINVKGGLLIASQNMVIGEITGHLENYRVLRPEQRPRYFLMLHFNHTYRPDIGRKTIPKEKEPVIGWLEAAIIRILRNFDGNLQITNEDSTHNAGNFQQAQQILLQETDEIFAANAKQAKYSVGGLVVRRPARSESEVIVQFMNILSRNYLVGYVIEGVPGNSTRYDAVFGVNLSTPAEDDNGPLAEWGVYKINFLDGRFVRTRKWMEFKKDLADVVDEFALPDGNPNKKYFEQVDLIISSVAKLPSGHAEYELFEFDKSNQSERNYPGSTHQLRKQGHTHVVEVIELQEILKQLQLRVDSGQLPQN